MGGGYHDDMEWGVLSLLEGRRPHRLDTSKAAFIAQTQRPPPASCANNQVSIFTLRSEYTVDGWLMDTKCDGNKL